MAILGGWGRRGQQVLRIHRCCVVSERLLERAVLLAHHSLVALRDHVGLHLLGSVDGNTHQDQQ